MHSSLRPFHDPVERRLINRGCLSVIIGWTRDHHISDDEIACTQHCARQKRCAFIVRKVVQLAFLIQVEDTARREAVIEWKVDCLDEASDALRDRIVSRGVGRSAEVRDWLIVICRYQYETHRNARFRSLLRQVRA